MNLNFVECTKWWNNEKKVNIKNFVERKSIRSVSKGAIFENIKNKGNHLFFRRRENQFEREAR